MPEQLALDQVFRDGGAVHLDKHLVLAQALRVDGARHQLFAGARLAVNQHAPVGRRHQRDLLAQRLHRNAVAHDHAARLKLLLVFEVFAAQTLGVDGVLQDDECSLEGKRLLEEVECPQLGGAHGGLDVAVARDHDDFGRIVHLDDALQRFQSVDAGQPDVEQHYIDGLAPSVARHSSPLSASTVL